MELVYGSYSLLLKNKNLLEINLINYLNSMMLEEILPILSKK